MAKSGKAEKFDCDFLRLDALRGLRILVSCRFDLLAVFEVLCSFMADVINDNFVHTFCIPADTLLYRYVKS
jgi:hypothetical protein